MGIWEDMVRSTQKAPEPGYEKDVKGKYGSESWMWDIKLGKRSLSFLIQAFSHDVTFNILKGYVKPVLLYSRIDHWSLDIGYGNKVNIPELTSQDIEKGVRKPQ